MQDVTSAAPLPAQRSSRGHSRATKVAAGALGGGCLVAGGLMVLAAVVVVGIVAAALVAVGGIFGGHWAFG